MANNQFDTPVTVKSAVAGSATSVPSPSKAMEYLLSGWTGKRGPKHREALQACHDSLSGEKSAATARRAFVAAAREAGLLVADKPSD